MDRCTWAIKGELEQKYHDLEWGVPIHNDDLLFEFLTLEGAQAGLSWSTILKKRENYRSAFANFNPQIVAQYNENNIITLMQNPGIIRNRLKIISAINNAKAVLLLQQKHGSFDKYIWSFVGGKTISNNWESPSQIPKSTVQAQAMSKDLQKHGFKFVGSTICYAFMQAVGMVNDHTTNCFRYPSSSK